MICWQAGRFEAVLQCAMAISTKFMQADLLLMPDDAKRREIVDGELFVMPSLSAHKSNERILISWEQ
jgi:hypothetical protein